jgi:hypothetical protein
VLRRILLIVLFCAVAWTTSALTMPRAAAAGVPVASVPLASAAPCAETGGSDRDSSSGTQWNAAPHASAAITESVWKLPLVHADLAGARCFDLFAAIGAASPPDRPARHAPLRPLRIPLLI